MEENNNNATAIIIPIKLAVYRFDFWKKLWYNQNKKVGIYMTIAEYIKINYLDMQFILECMYGLEDETLILLNSVKTDKWEGFNKLSKKKQEQAHKNLKDFILNFEDIFDEFCIMDILYGRCRILLNEFFDAIGAPERFFLPEEENIFFLKLPMIVDLRIILLDLKDYFAVDKEVLNKDNLMPIIKEVLKRLQNKNYIKYEEINDIDIKVLEIKNPCQKREVKNKQRETPISISKGQDIIRDILYNNNIPFAQEYNVKINGKIHRFDFAIFDANGIKYFIEYDGEQHFKAVEIWGGEEGLKNRQERDLEKNEWCKKNNIPLIRIPYTDKDIKLRDLQTEYSSYLL